MAIYPGADQSKMLHLTMSSGETPRGNIAGFRYPGCFPGWVPGHVMIRPNPQRRSVVYLRTVGDRWSIRLPAMTARLLSISPQKPIY